MSTQLYPFQRVTVDKAKEFNGRCLLALEQGLGKTLTSLTYLFETDSFPAVVVCPASLKFNWANEIKKHFGVDAKVLSGTKPKRTILRNPTNTIYVINYDILYAWVDLFIEMGVNLVILDEAQYTKSINARRTKACARLTYASEKMLALSGTPMEKTPLDLYPMLNMMFKGKFTSRSQFMGRYCSFYHGHFGIVMTGAKNMEELNSFLESKCMVRYKADDVLKDLPPFVRQTIFLEMTASQRNEYKHIQEEFKQWLRSKYPNRRVPYTYDAEVLTRAGYMKRTVASWKIPALIEQIDTFLNGTDGKLLIFGIHHDILNGIYNAFEKKNKTGKELIVRLDGTSSQQQREYAVKSLQENPYTRLFLGQIKAAGVGLTLTASHYSLFAEVDFLPTTHLQAEARNRRIGSNADFVRYNYVVMRGTIEEEVCQMLFERQQAIDTIVDGVAEQEAGSFEVGRKESVGRNLVDSYFQDSLNRFRDDNG